MKTKILFILLLVYGSLCASAQSEITKLKQTINAEKRHVQQLSNKRDNLITSYQVVAKDYTVTSARKDSLSQKPNSPAYKNAVKKADKLLKERTELLASIEQIKQDIDSLNIIIAGYESTLQQLQSQQTDSKKNKQSDKANQSKQKKERTSGKSDDRVENKVVEREKLNTQEKTKGISDEEREKLRDDNLQVIHSDKKEAVATRGDLAEKKTKTNEFEKDKELTFVDYLYLIGAGILFVLFAYYCLVKSLRCPKCGRWGTFRETGRTTVGKKSNGGGGYNYIHHIKYKCSECGYNKVREVVTNAKNKYDVS